MKKEFVQIEIRDLAAPHSQAEQRVLYYHFVTTFLSR